MRTKSRARSIAIWSAVAVDRRGRLGRHRPRPRGADLRRLADRRGARLLRDRLPLLRALHRQEGARGRPQAGDARRAARQRRRLPADGPARPVRPPLRRDRRRRPARRPRARRPDGLPARDDLDHRRRHLRRRRAGHGRSCSSRCAATARALGQMARDEIGPVGGVAALIAVFSIMIILLAVLALVVVNALAQSPWGMFSIAMTIPIAFLMGFYLRVLRPGRVLETTAIGVGAAAAGDRRRRLGAGVRRRARRLLHDEPDHDRVVPDRLRLPRLRAAGVDAAGAARLPVDLHEDRHDRACWRSASS